MKKMYSFRDRVSGVYSAPFVGDRNEAVIRGIRLGLTRGGEQPWQVFPRDNELYILGTFNEDSGVISPADPEFVCNLSDLIEE